MRTKWVEARKNDKIKTQLHYAKKGIITQEMEYVANLEYLEPEKENLCEQNGWKPAKMIKSKPNSIMQKKALLLKKWSMLQILNI
ncbi:hypothetical protein [Helicobacter pullorum]|uniref:hypothetical protein n=1 Tax=Helicobacter pullorum TaxID=35818 RepID=UPI0013151D79|nr:hypothetical protein [Helicobacter pullorum]